MGLMQTIEQEVGTFKQKIAISDGIEFEHYEILEQINLYMNDEFYDCDQDDAIFWNLGRPRSPHFAKKIDLDTKHFKATAYGDNNSYQGWILNMRFQRWARESGFALDLNDLSEGLSDYGSMVMKLMENDKGGYDLKECNLAKLYFDTTAETLDGETVIELHELTERQIRQKEGYWDNIDKALKLAEESSESKKENDIPKYEIWERVGEYYEGDDEPVFMHYVVCGTGDEEVILYEEEITPDKSPYYDFHISKFRGRWLRVGVYERLFYAQERVNTLVNENAQTTAISSLLLLASQEKQLTNHNVLLEAISGQILDTQDLRQIPIDNRNLSSFLQEMVMWEKFADKLCMTPEVITGEAMPHKTTFRGQAALTNLASSAFKNARDRIGFRVSKLLIDRILPAEVRDWNREDVFEIAQNDQDVRMYDAVAVKYKLNVWIMNQWANKKNPTMEQVEAQTRRIVENFDLRGRRITKMKNFFNFEFGFTMNPTGENVNKEQINDVYWNALQLKGQNPMYVNDPLFRQYLEENGIPAFKLSLAEMEQFMQFQNQRAVKPVKREDKLMAQIDTQ